MLIINWIKKHLALAICLIFFLSSVYTVFNTGKYENCTLLTWDMSNYHLYNPALFIYQDLQHLQFYKDIDSIYSPTSQQHAYPGDFHPETGKITNKYTAGVALFQLPLFLTAWAWTSIIGKYPVDGYSPPFQLSVALSSILFALAGLLILRSFLKKYFSNMAIAVSIAVIAFGTNLFFYSSLQSGTSHIYLFFLYSLILYSTQQWHEKPTKLHTILLGFAIGLATMTRPTDILIVLIPLGWNLFSHELRQNKYILFRKNLHLIVIAFICFSIPLFIQMLYWKSTSGNWIYYSYGEEGFNLLKSEVFKGLFSYRKGWFVYTPLAFVGIIGLLAMLKSRKHQFYAFPVLIYYVLTIYVVFSWHQWYYGGGFGCRPLLQSLALLAYPLSWIVNVFQKKSKILLISFLTVCLLGICLNLFQTFQYHRTVIHWSDMSKAYYWKVFLKTKTTPENLRFLGEDNEE